MPRSTPHPPAVTWSNQASICWGCRRPFRISEEAIRAQLDEEPTWTRADACNNFNFCLGCVQGESPAGEYDVLAYYGYRFEASIRPRTRRWVVLLCWKYAPEERSQERMTNTLFHTGRLAGEYVGRLNAAIAAAKESPVDIGRRATAQRAVGL